MSKSLSCAQNPRDSITVNESNTKEDRQVVVTIHMQGDPSVVFLSESDAIELADALYRIARISV